MKIKAVIWDWNGTLLDDLDFSVENINRMLKKRNLKTIDRDYYREIFDFPVRKYYKKLGFDVENEWNEMADEYITYYHENLHKYSIFKDCLPILEHFKKKNVPQYILSAMEHNALNKNVKDNGINDFFEKIEGIKNHYADSKMETGKNLIKEIDAARDEIIYVGDTTHDFDVARELGVFPFLVSAGHNSYARLSGTGAVVLHSLKGLFSFL